MPKGVRIGGRQKGTPNKTTAKAREAFALFADETFDEFKRWVFRVAKKDPKGAADLYLRATERHVPKLASAEVTGPDGGAFVVEIVKFTGDQDAAGAEAGILRLPDVRNEE